MARQRRIVSWLVLTLAAAGCFTATHARAQDITAQVPSLKWIPADAGSYNVALRYREQIDIIAKSKAWARLNGLQVVQLGWAMLGQEWNNPNGSLSKLNAWYNQQGNADLVAFLGELWSEEVFSYSDRNAADFATLIQEASNAGSSWANLSKLGKLGQKMDADPLMQVKAMLKYLADNNKRLKIPDQVTGYRLSKTKPAQAARMLNGIAQMLDQQLPPILQGRLKKLQVAGNDVHALLLDGAMIPWDAIPINMIEDVPGQYDDLIKHIKGMKLTIGVTVKDNYLLMSVGQGTDALKALGQGKRLVDRPEFTPAAKFADKKLTGISYTSKEVLSAAYSGGQYDVKSMLKATEDMLKDSGLPADKQAKIKKDVKALLADLDRATEEAGAHVSFTFMNQRGFETYSYDYTKNSGLESTKPLAILNHMGGEPIAYLASRGSPDVEGYDLIVKWLKVAHQYFDEFAVPQMKEREKEQYAQFMKLATPLLSRLDKATGKMLLPSLDGQDVILLDAKLKIKTPLADKELPMLEPAIVLGLKDAELFRQAMKEYRDIFNETVVIIAKLSPQDNIDAKIPEPKIKKTADGTLYMFPLMEVPGLDERIVPTGAIGKNVAVFAISEQHATRLLKKMPRRKTDGPLGDPTKPMAIAGHFSWAGLLDAAGPWVNTGLIMAGQGNDVIEHAQIALDILKVFRTYSSATYVEKGVVVTHSESVFRDLEK